MSDFDADKIDMAKFAERAKRMKEMEENLNNIVEAGVLADTQAALFEKAQRSGAKFEDVVNLYARTARASDNLNGDELEKGAE